MIRGRVRGGDEDGGEKRDNSAGENGNGSLHPNS